MEAQKNSIKKILTEDLTREERLIIVLYYYEQMTMKEIGATLDLLESYVSQKHLSILIKIRDKCKNIRDNYADCAPPESLIHVVQTINREILNYIKDHPKSLYNLQPRQFEELIAEILASFGWRAQLSPQTRDGGYDIYAITKEPKAGVQTSWIVECKKYAPRHKVGIDIVRKLHSVKISKNIGCMMLATTSDFTRDVLAFKESRYDLELKSFEEIIEWIKEYRPNPNGHLYLKDQKLTLP